MDTVESVLWLKKNNLFNKCVSYSQQLKIVFTQCLGVKDEDILVIGDTGSPGCLVAPIFAGSCFLAARFLNLNAKLVLQSPSLVSEPDGEVSRAIERIRPGSALVLSLSGKIGKISNVGKPFKRFCKERRLRYTSTPSLGTLRTSMISILVNSICLDYSELHQLHSSVKKIIDTGSVIHVRTKAGTDLTISVNGSTAVSSDGFFRTEGYGGNLPAGEVFIAPAKRGVEGRVVIDCSSRSVETTTIIKEPITLIIRNGEVAEIKGGKEAKLLEKSIQHGRETGKNDWGHRMIGEFGIGLNPNAKICGSMIIDEKVKGTAHIAIGSNHSFGGHIYASIHLDQVFKNPEITVDGRLLRIQ